MEFAVNELGQPVIYIVMRSYSDQYVQEEEFLQATVTLEEAQALPNASGCNLILEQNMLTGVTTPLHLIERQLEEKTLLVSLYKSGEKRRIFEELDVRGPFQEQLNFPIAPELEKAKKKVAAQSV